MCVYYIYIYHTYILSPTKCRSRAVRHLLSTIITTGYSRPKNNEFLKSVFKTVGLAEVGSGKGFTVRELLREVLRF